MDFDFTRFGLIGAGNTGKVPKKTEGTKANNAKETSGTVPVGKTPEAKEITASELTVKDGYNKAALGLSLNTSPIAMADKTDLNKLASLANVDMTKLQQKLEVPLTIYSRIGESGNEGMEYAMEAGTRANAESSATEIETLMNGFKPAGELKPVEEYFA